MFSARLYIRILLQVVAIVLVAGLGVAGIVTGRAVILGFVALFIAAWLISLLVYYLNASNRRIQLFREDLFYRINTIQIEIPPLRNRREDIALFVDYFLKKYTDLYGRPGLILHPQALEKLANYDWPGNIRELQHTIEKAVILAEKNVIRASDLFIRPGKALSFSEVPNLEEVERQAILAAITQNEGNLTAAAEQLGVSRQTLYNKMKRFNL